MNRKSLLLFLFLSAAAIAALETWTDVDLYLARSLARDGVAFPLRDAWWTSVLFHRALKAVLSVLAIAIAAPVLWDWWRPLARWSTLHRARMRILALSALLVPVSVTLLKRVSTTHCPWDLQEFGGSAAYVRLFEAAGEGAAGHCMPAGHASGALWLVAVAVFWLPGRPRRAAAVALAMLAFGTAVGWVQQLRGAHFLSHTLWSVWIACAVAGALTCARLPKNGESEMD